jgi:hypothetical protein
MRTTLSWSAAALRLALISVASAATPETIPKPFVVAPDCTDDQKASAIAVARITDPVLACFQLEKWSFKGVAIAVQPQEFADHSTSLEEFRQVRKQVFREQSARLRTERDLREALPGQPPSHASTPLSLFVRARTPLGVFLDETNHIGFADLLPLQSHNDQPIRIDMYPLLRLETLVLRERNVYRLIQMAPITGPSTIGEGFRMADDWARRLNGGERFATED